MLHVPLGFIVQDLVSRAHTLSHPSRLIAAVLVPGVVLLAWAANRYYDAPVRRALLAHLRERHAARPVATGTGEARATR